uniref:Uncharacterized protein n=1 Tax=Panagrolaimus superbus TaxID=310955 RepID=A0A914YKJ2_9BILA
MCSFHVRQCIHRQYQQRGLTADFPDDTKKFIKECATRIGGLQHIPAGLIDEAVAALQIHLEDSVEQFEVDVVGSIRSVLNVLFCTNMVES